MPGNASLHPNACLIVSPSCPVFRDDSGALLHRVALASFISSAAPNAGAIRRGHPREVDLIPGTLARRAEYVLALAASQNHPSIVLGAWGCGVFQNDPDMVAGTFAGLLFDQGWARRFVRVTFSVLDTSHSLAVYRAFAEKLNLRSA